MSDFVQQTCEAIKAAGDARTPLRIQGGGTKSFYGRRTEGELLETGSHAGIVDYEPAELVVTARAGMPLADLEAALAGHGQMLPFEPPHFGEGATIGGAIASGLSGPRRPHAGAVRDLVLGCRIINGFGEALAFGGQVMKNVAGYDISRLMAGALGTLGVITEVSMKVLPEPAAQTTLAFDYNQRQAIEESMGRAPAAHQRHLPRRGQVVREAVRHADRCAKRRRQAGRRYRPGRCILVAGARAPATVLSGGAAALALVGSAGRWTD